MSKDKEIALLYSWLAEGSEVFFKLKKAEEEIARLRGELEEANLELQGDHLREPTLPERIASMRSFERDTSYKRGFIEAIEMAAQVAEDMARHSWTQGTVSLGRIAKNIRSINPVES